MAKNNKSGNVNIAPTEFLFNGDEKEKLEAELILANKEIAFKDKEKGKREVELIIANKELFFQNEEKENRAAELVIANKELAFQNKEKEKRAAELSIANTELVFQKKEKKKRAAELIVANKELVFQNIEKKKRLKENKELKAISNSVKQASQYTRSLIEASLDPLVTISPEGKITDVNEAFVKVIGVPRLKLIGTDFSEHFTEPKKAREGYMQVFKKGFVSDYPLTIHHKNGKLTDVLYNATVYKDEKGNVLGVFAAARDVTAQKAEELSIANKELIVQNKEKEKQAAVLGIANTKLKFQNQERENRAAELVIANKELAFQNGEKENRAAELAVANKELAFQNEEKENRAAELVIANKELLFQNEEKENRAAELVVANKELLFQNEEKEKRAADLVIANKELAFQNEEKEKRAVDLIVLSEALKNQKAELREANEELNKNALLLKQQEDKLIRINNDLLLLNQHLEKRVLDRTSDLEKLNNQLKDLSLSKDKFLSVISHDLRNPLTALLIASEQLSNDVEEHVFDEIQPYAKSIHRSSNNILKQLNELVDWAKRQQEKTSFNPEKLKLFFAVDQSFELLKANARQKDIVLDNNVAADIYVMADFLMLRSILQNLVTNAIKFSMAGGLVKVFAQRVDAMVEVCVNDVGIGMEEIIHKNLFSQTGSTIESGTNNEKGSGLGLILVKDFVSQHQGLLRVESEIKKGTSIFFTIPIC